MNDLNDLIEIYTNAIEKMDFLIKKYLPEARKRGTSKKIYLARVKVKEFKIIKADLQDAVLMMKKAQKR